MLKFPHLLFKWITLKICILFRIIANQHSAQTAYIIRRQKHGLRFESLKIGYLNHLVDVLAKVGVLALAVRTLSLQMNGLLDIEHFYIL